MSIMSAVFVFLSVVLLADTFFKVPKFHFGIHERLGNRTGTIYFEGWGIKLPYIDKIELVSLELSEIEVLTTFTTGKAPEPKPQNAVANATASKPKKQNGEDDKIAVTMTGSLQYRPNPFVVDDQGRNIFITMSEAIIKGGVEDVLSDMLGGLGGINQAEDFIENRQAFGDMVNQILKTGKPYHFHHEKDGKCGDANCKFKNTKMIPREGLIEFYNLHWERIKAVAASNEKKRKNRMPDISSPIPWIGYAASFTAEPGEPSIDDVSTIERRYGISTETFALANIGFSEDVKKAFEKKREAKERRKAFDIKLDMAARAKKSLEIDGQVALNAADVSLTPEIAKNKTIASVEGNAGVLGALINAATGRRAS